MPMPSPSRLVLAVGTLVVGLLVAGSLLGADAPARVAARTAQPVIEPARGGQCVQDAAFMRRNHMELLRHDRDATVRAGVRDTRHSLKACIDCHASKTTDSVSSASTNFCQSCHVYTAVKIDCFECHANKPAPGSAQVGVKP